MKRTANDVRTEGAIKICESLMVNTTLTKLNLYNEDQIEKKER